MSRCGRQMPTQAEIAKHLDMSERNAREVLKSLGIDWTAASIDDIRIAYIRDLRDKAAGRGGDDQASLTRARTREAEASAELKLLQIKEKAGELVPLADIEPMLTAMITAARQELLTLPDKVANDLRALHGVEVDAGLIEERIHAALEHLAGGLQEDGAGDVPPSLPRLGAAAEDFDS